MAQYEKIAAAAPVLGKALGGLKKFFGRGYGSLDKEVARGLKVKSRGGGVPESFFLMPAAWAAKKLKGDQKVKNLLWKGLQRPALSADIAGGNVAHDAFKRIPGMKNMFKLKERIPVRRGKEKLYKEISRSSATAPLVKARDIAVPFALGLGAEKLIKDIRGTEKGVE